MDHICAVHGMNLQLLPQLPWEVIISLWIHSFVLNWFKIDTKMYLCRFCNGKYQPIISLYESIWSTYYRLVNKKIHYINHNTNIYHVCIRSLSLESAITVLPRCDSTSVLLKKWMQFNFGNTKTDIQLQLLQYYISSTGCLKTLTFPVTTGIYVHDSWNRQFNALFEAQNK